MDMDDMSDVSFEMSDVSDGELWGSSCDDTESGEDNMDANDDHNLNSGLEFDILKSLTQDASASNITNMTFYEKVF